jgi:S-adenosylmethionine uptake transporter
LAVATLGVALFSIMDGVMKGLSLAVGTYNAVFWRMVLGVALSGIVYLATRPERPPAGTLRLHAVRGVVTSAMALTFFWGLTRLPLAEAIALSFVGPLIALYLAAILLREQVGPRAVSGSVLAFSGVLVIVATRSSAAGQERDLWGAASILCAAVLWAYNMILMRKQALVARPLEIAFFQNLFVSLCLGLGAPFFVTIPAAAHWSAITLSAVLALASLVLLAWAYAREEAQRLAPLEYTGLLWAALLGWLMFREPLMLSTLVGAALIIGGCTLATRRNRSHVTESNPS